jgi:transcriptional regulator with GAF, ATPase, and Fis domain
VQARTHELAQSVEELQALGEVTQAVNSTLDLQMVLSTIVAKAVQLSGTEAGAIYVFDEVQQLFRLRATYGLSEELIAAIEDQHIGASDAIRQVTQDRQPWEIADIGEATFPRVLFTSCRLSRPSRYWQSRTRACSARSRTRAANCNWRASTSPSSSPA